MKDKNREVEKGITERLTPRKDWFAIKTGQVIYNRWSGTPRQVIEAHDGFVTLVKIKESWTKNPFTVYVPCDRHFFIV